jgi:integrative and conjugative element protein (TIGR02256 family)
VRFIRSNGGVLQLAPAVVRLMQRHRQLAPQDPEAGGILLGRLIRDGDGIVIDGGTTPSLSDRATRTTFFRGQEHTQRVVDWAWTASKGTLVYLGEWHTHPENRPTPSMQDRRNWANIFWEAEFEHAFLVFFIVGRQEIRCWEVRPAGRDRRDLRFTRLTGDTPS